MEATGSPKKEKSKKSKTSKGPKKVSTHPKYHVMVKAAITELKERRGSSRQAILKYILNNYKVGPNTKMVNVHLKLSLRAGLRSGKLKQTKGSGASGSFKLEEKPSKGRKKRSVKKPKSDKSKSDKPKKMKSKTTKKPKKTKKTKSPKKPKKAKSPKKERKPKSPKRKRSPKKKPKTTKKKST